MLDMYLVLVATLLIPTMEAAADHQKVFMVIGCHIKMSSVII